jgi:hypothetical protein
MQKSIKEIRKQKKKRRKENMKRAPGTNLAWHQFWPTAC